MTVLTRCLKSALDAFTSSRVDNRERSAINSVSLVVGPSPTQSAFTCVFITLSFGGGPSRILLIYCHAASAEAGAGRDFFASEHQTEKKKRETVDSAKNAAAFLASFPASVFIREANHEYSGEQISGTERERAADRSPSDDAPLLTMTSRAEMNRHLFCLELLLHPRPSIHALFHIRT